MASFKRGGIRNAILRVLAEHSAPGIIFARADFTSRARSGNGCHVGETRQSAYGQIAPISAAKAGISAA